MLAVDAANEDLEFHHSPPPANSPLMLPKTVDAAVEQIVAEMDLKDSVAIANMAYEELPSVHVALGNWIRHHFNLWEGNPDLRESCRTMADNYFLTGGDAALVIIESLWGNLRETHRLRLI